MSRFGLDYALDTMGVVHGGTSCTPISNYLDGNGAPHQEGFVGGLIATGATKLFDNNLKLIGTLS